MPYTPKTAVDVVVKSTSVKVTYVTIAYTSTDKNWASAFAGFLLHIT